MTQANPQTPNDMELPAELEQTRQQLQRRESELTAAMNRLAAEHALAQAGAVDVEAACDLLAAGMDLTKPVSPEDVSRAARELIAGKPYLRRQSAAGLPPATAAPRSGPEADERAADAARRAARDGDRRALAEYLRLRRRAAGTE